MAGETSFPETAETETLEKECGYDFAAEKSKSELLISDLQEKPHAVIVKNEEMGEMVLKLKKQTVDLEEKYEQLKEQLFSFKNIPSNDSLTSFYMGLPNYQTMVALYNYLDTGATGENINYWLSGKDVAGTAKPIKQGRPRSLKPVDEFFFVTV